MVYLLPPQVRAIANLAGKEGVTGIVIEDDVEEPTGVVVTIWKGAETYIWKLNQDGGLSNGGRL